MKPSTFLSLYEKLEKLVHRLPDSLQQPILREITPIKTIFLLQRAPRLVLLGPAGAGKVELLRALFGAPELHHWHHLETAVTQHNFANLAPWTDLLFGTYHVPPGDESWPLGNPGEPPRGYFAHLVSPFRRTARPPVQSAVSPSPATRASVVDPHA